MKGPTRILIVDDSSIDRDLLSQQLRRHGFIIGAVSSGESALRELRESSYELVLLDVMMPEVGGLEVLKRIREQHSRIQLPVIMITGRDDGRCAAEALNAGANDYVTKPINFDTALARIRTHLELRETAYRLTETLEQQAHEHAAHTAALFNQIDVGIVTMTEDGRIEAFNPGAELIFACPADQAVGLDFHSFIREEVAEPDSQPRGGFDPYATLNDRVTAHALTALSRRGDQVPVEMSVTELKVPGRKLFTAIIRDISDQVASERTIRKLAMTDVLTGLANRSAFTDQLNRLLADRRGDGHKSVLLFVDLDGFKEVNDVFGHPTGDKVLIEVARRMAAAARTNDLVARFGGDEFAILMTDFRHEDLIDRAIDRILTVFHDPVIIAGQEHPVGASIGVSRCPEDGTSVDELVRKADVALYQAKLQEGNSYCFFDPAMDEEVHHRKAVTDAMRASLVGGVGFELHYQPQVNTRTGAVIGVEALARFHHPDVGQIPPSRFIPYAETSGLIGAIGDWALHTAAQFATRLPPQVSMCVNISAVQFNDERLPGTVAALLESTGLEPHRLKLELTEGAFVDDVNRLIPQMLTLQSMGLSFSIDDFGTGYSSLSYLRSLPLNQLKIDRSFVIDLDSGDEDARAVAHAIIALGTALGLEVIAEGVENPAQLEVLRALGCDVIQGYLESPPLRADELLNWLAARPAAEAD